ncbi:MAG: chloride channel protein [Lachnospiraceae bacterium]|nr:chloride channel protein [Lachnospiraceae bacterium]
MNKDRLKHKLIHDGKRLATSFKWIIFAIITGIIVGLMGTLLLKGINLVSDFRTEHPYCLLLLPFGAVIIIAFYRALGARKSRGTNLVLSAIHSNEEIPLRMAPLIFISTIFSHFCGASIGREGAALQLGGSIGDNIGKMFKFDKKSQHIMIMCGMSGAFSALFGTPMAAAIFSMEVVSVGIMHYAALVPCVISSLIARTIARAFGVAAPSYSIMNLPEFSIRNVLIIVGLSLITGVVSMIFCIMLHKGEYITYKLFNNQYLRAFVLGSIILLITALLDTQKYSGAGVNYIEEFIHGNVDPWDAALKILLTVLALCAGYKGGEIVPTFFIGAALGALFGNIVGLSPSLCAAVGIGGMFCGVTNCPITSLLICLELFGLDGMPYYILSIAFSYMFSGYYGLYSSQKIVYSKYNSNFINKNSH